MLPNGNVRSRHRRAGRPRQTSGPRDGSNEIDALVPSPAFPCPTLPLLVSGPRRARLAGFSYFPCDASPETFVPVPDNRLKNPGEKRMSLQVLMITSALVVGSVVSATAQQSGRHRSHAPFGAYGGGVGSLFSICARPCGVYPGVDFLPLDTRKCIFKCIQAKRAAQH